MADVKAFDPLKYDAGRPLPRFVAEEGQALLFEAAKETLDHAVVPAIAFAVHAALDLAIIQLALERLSSSRRKPR